VNHVIHGAEPVVKEQCYRVSARTVGATPVRIIAQHGLPNVPPPLIVICTINLASTVISESASASLS